MPRGGLAAGLGFQPLCNLRVLSRVCLICGVFFYFYFYACFDEALVSVLCLYQLFYLSPACYLFRFFETSSYVAEVGLELLASCFYLLNAGLEGAPRHLARFHLFFFPCVYFRIEFVFFYPRFERSSDTLDLGSEMGAYIFFG